MNPQQKQKIKRISAKVFYPYFRAVKLFDREPKFTILMYHFVNPNHPFSILPNEFDQQIKFLVSNYQVLPLKDFLNFSKNSLTITFDDGYENNFNFALPILKNITVQLLFLYAPGLLLKKTDITQKGVYRGLKPLSVN